MDQEQTIIRLKRERDTAIDALRALFNNPHINLGDLIYDIRESEGEGWDGKSVKAWGDAIQAAEKILND